MQTAIIILIAIIVLAWSICDIFGFKYKVKKFERIKVYYEQQERRFDWLNALLSSIKTHSQLCDFHLILHNTLKSHDYHSVQYIKLKELIESKEQALRKLRVKEGEDILKSVKL